MSNQPPPPPFDENARRAPPPAYNKEAPLAKSTSNITSATPSSQIAQPAPPPPAPPAATPTTQPATVPSQRVVVQQIVQPAAPSGEEEPLKPKVIYVDQYGNPITGEASQKILHHPPPTQPMPVMGSGESEPLKPKYQVDSSGRLVTSHPPPATQYSHAHPLTSTTASQGNIQYVDQHGNHIQVQPAPSAVQPADTSPTKPDGMSTKEKSARMAVFVIACISALMLFIGLCVNTLSEISSTHLTQKCGFTSISQECDSTSCEYWWSDLEADYSYSDYCATTFPEACSTQAAGLVALFTMLIAFIETVVATVFIQIWCKINQCCLEGNKFLWGARVHIGVAIVMSLLGLIIWIAVDELCFDYFEHELGGTMILNIIGMAFNIIALIVLFSTGTA